MIASELQIAAWSTDDDRLPAGPPMEGRGVGAIDVRFLTEGAIAAALLDDVAAAGNGDEIGIAVETSAIGALIAALLARGGARRARASAAARKPHAELERGRRTPRERCRAHRGALVTPRDSRASHLKLLLGPAPRRFVAESGLGELYPPQSRRSQSRGGRGIAHAGARRDRACGGGLFRQAVGRARPRTADTRPMTSAADYWRYRIAEATGLSSF